MVVGGESAVCAGPSEHGRCLVGQLAGRELTPVEGDRGADTLGFVTDDGGRHRSAVRRAVAAAMT